MTADALSPARALPLSASVADSVPPPPSAAVPAAQPVALPAVPFAEPTPLGLIGLAIGCASLLPIAFGAEVGPAALRTAAVFCLLFGGGGQLLAGILNLANKNLLGGTVFTAFAFNWMLNAWLLWSVAHGSAPDHQILLATEAASLVLFVPLTYAFGVHSKLLFLFLLDIDLLYVAKLARGYFAVPGMELPIAVLTLGLGLIALYIALAMLVNPTVGKKLFPVPGPMFHPAQNTSMH